MSEKLWENDSGDVALLANDEGEVVLKLGDRRAVLESDAARALADALYALTGQSSTVEHDGGFQVYYVHEYSDHAGDVVPCPALGVEDGDSRFTWDEAALDAVGKRLKTIGETVAVLHRKHNSDAENSRAWISIYRMPEDECVWKGYWDDFDGEVDD
jgi:hypothetical protein